MIQAGVSPAYVKKQMGHRSIQVTIDVYGCLIPGENVAWIDTLDSTPIWLPKSFGILNCERPTRASCDRWYAIFR